MKSKIANSKITQLLQWLTVEKKYLMLLKQWASWEASTLLTDFKQLWSYPSALQNPDKNYSR